MTDDQDIKRGPDGLLTDPDAARAEARHGWFMLTSFFVAGAVLVALAALVT
jgi:hypothetical protein